MNVKLKEYFNISDALIGVHCTHGVNRTGYLICRYLIEKLDWDPQKAIDGKFINFETGFCLILKEKVITSVPQKKIPNAVVIHYCVWYLFLWNDVRVKNLSCVSCAA